MRILINILGALVLACGISALGLLRVRDEGAANSDLENSWVATKSASSPDILLSRPLPAPHPFPDPRMASWHREAHGLPVQWLIRDHSPDGIFYYARLDVGHAGLSVFTSFIPSLLAVFVFSHFLRPSFR